MSSRSGGRPGRAGAGRGWGRDGGPGGGAWCPARRRPGRGGLRCPSGVRRVAGHRPGRSSRAHAEVAAQVGHDVGHGAGGDVVVEGFGEVGAVEALQQFGVQRVRVEGGGTAVAGVEGGEGDAVLAAAQDVAAGERGGGRAGGRGRGCWGGSMCWRSSTVRRTQRAMRSKRAAWSGAGGGGWAGLRRRGCLGWCPGPGAGAAWAWAASWRRAWAWMVRAMSWPMWTRSRRMARRGSVVGVGGGWAGMGLQDYFPLWVSRGVGGGRVPSLNVRHWCWAKGPL